MGSLVLVLGSSGSGGVGASEGSADELRALFATPLVVPEIQVLDGGEQLADARRALSVSPQAQASRQASRTKFAGIGGAQVARLAQSAYPAVVSTPAYSAPRLPAGQRIVGYPSDNVAQVALAGGGHAVIDSPLPFVTRTSSGRRVPVDLGLVSVGGAFEPAHSPAPVEIPRRLSQGVRLSRAGVSVTPVTRSGAPLGGVGAVEGATVLYPSTQTDTDTLVKPLAFGVETDTLLRSQDSPEEFAFHLAVPSGMSVVPAAGGGLAVSDGVSSVAGVLRPSAVDAQGTPVPVSMRASGDGFVLTVKHRTGDYAYPILVDPTITDKALVYAHEGQPGNWLFNTNNSTAFIGSPGNGGLYDIYGTTAYSSGQIGYYEYRTQHESRIYGFIGSVTEEQYLFEPTITNKLALWRKSGTVEKVEALPEHTAQTYYPEVKVCIVAECAVAAVAAEGGVHEENSAIFEQEATAPGQFFTSVLGTASIEINQETGPAVSVDTADTTVGGALNGLYPGHWASGPLAKIGLIANDPGIGINKASFSSPQAKTWGHEFEAVSGCQGVQCDECWDLATRCASEHSTSGTPVPYSLNGLPDGVDTIEAKVENATGQTATTKTSVSMDSTAPYGLAVTGLPESHEIGEGQYHVRATATDGSGSPASSGIASITFKLAGKEIGSPSGSCTPGPCTTSSTEWTLSGNEFGAGKQTLTVIATDGAGNTVKEEIPITVHHASSIPDGPGAVEPVTGEFSLGATDVSMTAPGTGLTVNRTYKSRHLSEGIGGPLGPQWSMSVGGEATLVKQSDGSMLLTDSNGGQTLFASNGKGGFNSPVGDAGLALTEKVVGSSHFFQLSSRGSVTTFTVPSGGGGSVWMPSSAEGPGGTNLSTFAFQTVGGVTEPTRVTAPVPAGVTCTSIVKGCRALTFNYATSTTATGESASGWGDYNGRLTRVYFNAWDPSTGTVTTTAVAQYAYDTQGRLRAEWDPRLSTPLKTTYGYDAAGHVTAVSAAGQQPWLFAYGAIVGDPNTGRLLTVSRPAASTTLGNGSAPVNTAAPTLSTSSPVMGTSLSVSSNGTWSNSPLAYSYQWEDCASGGTGCVPIAGATNQSYTPVASDAGYALVAQVTAVNANASVLVSTAASSLVAGSTPAYSLSFGSGGSGEGQFAIPARAALSSSGNVWVTDKGQGRVEKFTGSGTFSAAYGSVGSGNGQFSSPVGIAIEQASGNVYVADQGNNRIEELNSGGEFVRAWGSVGSGQGQFKAPAGIAVDSRGDVWVADSGNNRVQEFSSTGVFMVSFGSTGSGNGQLSSPASLTVAGGDVYVADLSNNRVEEFTTLGAYVTKWGSLGSGNGQFNAPKGIGVDPTSGDVLVTDTVNNRVQEFTATGTYITQFGAAGSGNGQFSEPADVAVGSSGSVYVVDAQNNRVEKWKLTYASTNQPAAPSPGTTAVWTMAYHVPVSGTGAPYGLGSSEAAGWAQADLPTEASAIFPPDEPVAFPPANYTRATVYYLDGSDRSVNVAKPGGGITTTEYNSYNDIVRTLSAANRATALEAGKGSAAQSQLLDNESTYGSEGTELLSTLGAQSTVKLASGSTVTARRHTQYSYDENAPSGGPYRLVTKMTEGAQISGEPEADVRTTVTSYSGQGNLGWLLRKPTSTLADPGGLEIKHTTVYDPVTGNVTETRQPGSEGEEPGYSFRSAFGTKGTGNGQFTGPEWDAIDASGNVWVSDSADSRVEKFSSQGTFIAAYGSHGSENGQFSWAGGVAISPTTGYVFVTDEGLGRIEEFDAEGKWIRTIGKEGAGNGEFDHPSGIAVDSSGNVWVADYNNNRVQELNSEGKWLRNIGSKGKEKGQFEHPADVTFSGGNLYVVDSGNNRVEEFTTGGTCLAVFGSGGTHPGQLTEPQGIATDPVSGNLLVTDTGNARVEVFTPSGGFLEAFGSYGASNGTYVDPTGLAFNAAGNLYVVDYGNNRVQQLAPVWAPTYTTKFGSEGKGNGQLLKAGAMSVDTAGNVWVADTANNRVEEFNSEGKFLKIVGSEGKGNGQLLKPEGISVEGGEVWVADTGNNRVEEFTTEGFYQQSFGTAGGGFGQFKAPTAIVAFEGALFVLDTGNNRVQECFESTCLFMWGGLGSGNGLFKAPEGLAVDSSGDIWVADSGNNRIQELNFEGKYMQQFGTSGSGAGQLSKPEGLALDSEGNVWVADGGNSRVQEFTASGAFVLQMGVKGSEDQQLNTPAAVAFKHGGSDFYILDTLNNRVQKWHEAPPHEATSNGGAHATQTIYYTAGTNPLVSACGKHPEWANLPCQDQPAAQPETAGLPNLPVTTYTYNVWDEMLTKVETSGTTTRTTTNTYDAAGRQATTASTSTVGTAVPTVTNEYESATGELHKQSTTVEGSTKSITSVFNTLGQLTNYTDADGNEATYKYDIDGRQSTVNDGKGTQTSTYDTTTGNLTSLADSAAGTFTATYNSNGDLTSEHYPNGMTAKYTIAATGMPSSLEYVKTTHCESKCTWYSDSIVPSIHGQTLSQTSTLSNQAYTYDNVGRLTQTQDTPTGQGCTTRVYSYDADTNRTSVITRAPGVGGVCTSTGGTTETHGYDSADRLTDTGAAYDAFGDITALSAVDSGGSELTSGYYADGQLQSQTQNGQTIGYGLDPAGRPRETTSTGKIVATETSHYAGPGNSPAWKAEPSAQWTREIGGIGVGLVAIQHNGEAAVLQLTNLHGDIVATASLSETATSLLGSGDSTEYGIPRTSLPPKYSWLGMHEIPTELPSGVLAMGARSYVPQIGRFLQPDPVVGGSPNPYAYTNADPVNESDLTGLYSITASATIAEALFAEAAAAAAQRAAEEAAARAAAEAAAAAAEAEAEAYGGMGGEWEEEGEEYEYEGEEWGGGEEFIAWMGGGHGFGGALEAHAGAESSYAPHDAITWTASEGEQPTGADTGSNEGEGRRQDVRVSCALRGTCSGPLYHPYHYRRPSGTQCRVHYPPSPIARPGYGHNDYLCPACEAQKEVYDNMREGYVERSKDRTDEIVRAMSGE